MKITVRVKAKKINTITIAMYSRSTFIQYDRYQSATTEMPYQSK